MPQSGPWDLYDRLIENVPEGSVLEKLTVTRRWALAKIDAPGGAGLAHIAQGGRGASLLAAPGTPAREAAGLVKSWDFAAAATGLAVINAALNAQRLSMEDAEKPYAGNGFDILRSRASGKKVAVIGHFPRLEAIREAAREMIILERDPQEGDLPDAAAEFVLPEAELVFMTGSSAVNKTMPRLLELSKGAEIHLVGPSVPLMTSLLKGPLASLSGVLITDYPALSTALKLAADGSLEISRAPLRRVTYLSERLCAQPPAVA
ncbi:MAG: DUF364 domain-containing protein [Deltaproteobacteria bacterium]|jgi:uncharacterized protein (DUF4213/DUF364 family)|nr:DUF364 domain-containing protein [Deltaproteobacteria bacterium]